MSLRQILSTRALVRAVTAVNRGVEACIRRSPAQYYWAYMRFRRRPVGEPPFYPW
jgi:KDO2-lipid IV(A) lauroyltransferase